MPHVAETKRARDGYDLVEMPLIARPRTNPPQPPRIIGTNFRTQQGTPSTTALIALWRALTMFFAPGLTIAYRMHELGIAAGRPIKGVSLRLNRHGAQCPRMLSISGLVS
jgi:hypothetical protein